MQMIGRCTNTLAGVVRPQPASPEEEAMLRALELAEKGRRTVSPNPAVGAVVVDGGVVVGEGYHEMAGGPHAEAVALAEAGRRARGAEMFVTLEPCSHHGRTPPCVDSIVEAGLRKVVMAARDPNPRVSGGGARVLREAGVEAIDGPFEKIARRINEAYLKWVTTGSPLVTLKAAVTLDGKVATRTGDSRWVSGEVSRRDVHEERARSDVVMVGLGTVLADDPVLTAREVGASRQPLRVIVDGGAVLPAESRVLDIAEAPTAVAVGSGAARENIARLEGRGVTVIVAGEGLEVDLRLLMEELGRREITSVYAEGGPTLGAELFAGRLVDRMVAYIAPRVAGGRDAPGPVGGAGVELMREAESLEIDTVREMGPDIKVVAYPAGRTHCSRGW